MVSEGIQPNKPDSAPSATFVSKALRDLQKSKSSPSKTTQWYEDENKMAYKFHTDECTMLGFSLLGQT